MDTPVIVAVVAALVLTAGGGLLTPIDGWYAALRKPSWNPPNWAFGPAWTIILGLWAWSGVLAWRGVRPFSVLASWLIVPYFAWVSFAACLNAAIVARNRPFG